MPPAPPLITLLTDFGTREYFVASLKGVILTIHPDARIVDLSHDIAPFGILEAAYCLSASYRYFPEGTIHVAVVDPGVGTDRRPLLVKTDRYCFISPDNGLLTPIFRNHREAEVRELENRRYRLESPGATFHGRDLFAPAAAWLAKGEAPSSFGRRVTDPIELPWPEAVIEGQSIVGQVVYRDRFGNLISNISKGHLEGLLGESDHPAIVIRIAGREIEGVVDNYRSGVQAGGVSALINSNGWLEIFVREDSAASILNVHPRAPIVVEVLCR